MENTITRSSRRSFFSTGALTLGAGAAALTIAPRAAQAQTGVTDLQILNFALGLEHLEAAFYNQGLARFSASDFASAAFVPLVGTLVAAKAFDNLKAVQEHENTHVETLRTVIRSLGGTPVAACQYNFGVTNFNGFLATAAVLEGVGVMAYTGALGMIQNPDLRTAGATIATVEARHAAYLNLLLSDIPFPAATDMTRTMAEILTAAGPFITTCTAVDTGGGGTATTKAVAGPKNATTVQKFFSLDGTASTSSNGAPLTYNWIVLSGTAGMTKSTTAMPSVQFGVSGPYTFELTVTDSTGVKATDTVTVNYFGH
jgi:rubrerythrin